MHDRRLPEVRRADDKAVAGSLQNTAKPARGETPVPFGALRGRLSEPPKDRCRRIIGYCEILLYGHEPVS